MLTALRKGSRSFLKLDVFKNGVLEGSKLDLGGPRSRFWRLRALILKPSSLDFEASSLDFEASRLDCGSSRPPAFFWLCFPHSATQLDKCGAVSCLGFLPFLLLPFFKDLAKVWEAAASPLGGLQWNLECKFNRHKNGFGRPRNKKDCQFDSACGPGGKEKGWGECQVAGQVA